MGEYINSGKQVLFRNYEEGGAAPLIHIADAVDNEKAHFLATMANCPKGEDGSFLPAFDYVDEAHVTLSNEFHGNLVSRRYFSHALNDAIDAINRLDKVKKSLFYGRDNNIKPTEGTQGCGDLPGLIAGLPGIDGNPTLEEASNLIHGVIGVVTEGGELLELLRDTINGKPLDKTNLQEEVGDAKWYMAILARVGGFLWGSDERLNIAKLRKRFVDKFAAYDANNRDLTAERAILEGDAANQLALPIHERAEPMDGEKQVPVPGVYEDDVALSRYEAGGGYVPQFKNTNSI